MQFYMAYHGGFHPYQLSHWLHCNWLIYKDLSCFNFNISMTPNLKCEHKLIKIYLCANYKGSMLLLYYFPPPFGSSYRQTNI